MSNKPPAFRPQNQLAAAVAKGLIIQPEEAAERLKAQRIQHVQAHLDVADVEREAAVDLFSALLVAETHRGGVPDAAGVERIRAVAKEVTRQRYAEKWAARAEIFAELGVAEVDKPSGPWVWAAKKHGIDLLPVVEAAANPPPVIVPEPPRLVTE